MTEIKVVPLDPDQELSITLEEIQFGTSSDVVEYSLNIGDGRITFPVTVSEEYADLAELHRLANQALFLILRQLAEYARRQAGAPELSFEPPQDVEQ